MPQKVDGIYQMTEAELVRYRLMREHIEDLVPTPAKGPDGKPVVMICHTLTGPNGQPMNLPLSILMTDELLELFVPIGPDDQPIEHAEGRYDVDAEQNVATKTPIE